MESDKKLPANQERKRNLEENELSDSETWGGAETRLQKRRKQEENSYANIRS